MKKARHKPIEVEFVHVVAPYKAFKAAFRQHHEVKLPSGRLAYFHVVDATGRSKAYPGDYLLKHSDGKVEIVTEKYFNETYEEIV